MAVSLRVMTQNKKHNGYKKTNDGTNDDGVIHKTGLKNKKKSK